MSRVYEYYQEGEQLPLDEQQQLEYLEWYNQQKEKENGKEPIQD